MHIQLQVANEYRPKLFVVNRIHLRTAAVGYRFSVMKLPLLETNINKLQKDGFYKITYMLQLNYKGLQLYTISDPKFLEKEMFVNDIEDICSLINIGTYTGRVT